MTAAFPGDDHSRPDDDRPDDDEISRRFSDIVAGISTEMNWDVDDAEFDDLDAGFDDQDGDDADDADDGDDSADRDDGDPGAGPASGRRPDARLVPPAASDDPAERRRRRREQRKMERTEEVLAFKAEQARREAEYAADDEHFVPAEPPPLTWPKIRTVIAILILLGGFFLLLGPNFLSIGPNAVLIMSAAMILLGGSLLIAGLRGHRTDPGEGWDDGSRV